MERVTFGSESLPGFVVGPKGAPGVIVLQEWWGITDEVKLQAERLSRDGGFRCLVPDLYKGSLGVDMEEAGHLMSNLDFPQAVKEIGEAAKFLKELEGSPKVGATGFCMGGALTILSVGQIEDVCCGVPWYGIPQGFDASTVTKPVEGHFGELDVQKGFSDAESARALEAALIKGNPASKIYVYPGVGHAFMNADPVKPNIKEGVDVTTPFPPLNAEVQDLAWKRMVDFLKANCS